MESDKVRGRKQEPTLSTTSKVELSRRPLRLSVARDGGTEREQAAPREKGETGERLHAGAAGGGPSHMLLPWVPRSALMAQ